MSSSAETKPWSSRRKWVEAGLNRTTYFIEADPNDVRWLSQAACEGADPRLFDSTVRPHLNFAVTRYCKQCPVRPKCMRRVMPAQSKYDGVAGGYVWRQGRQIH